METHIALSCTRRGYRNAFRQDLLVVYSNVSFITVMSHLRVKNILSGIELYTYLSPVIV